MSKVTLTQDAGLMYFPSTMHIFRFLQIHCMYSTCNYVITFMRILKMHKSIMYYNWNTYCSVLTRNMMTGFSLPTAHCFKNAHWLYRMNCQKKYNSVIMPQLHKVTHKKSFFCDRTTKRGEVRSPSLNH